MSLLKVNISEIDGALAILPSGTSAAVAVLGSCASGVFALPAAWGDPKALANYYTRGPAAQQGAHILQKYGTPVLMCRSAQTTAASFTTVTHTGAGTSVVTSTGSNCDDDYEAYLFVKTGCTIGVAGGVINVSLDGGRTLSADIAIGTAVNYTIPNSGGVTFAFAAGTLLANQTESFRCTAPIWNNTDLAASIQALENSLINWELLIVVGALNATAAAVIDANINAKRHAWIGGVRVPTIGEDDPTYTASLGTAFASYSTLAGELCAGSGEIISAIDGRAYMRSARFALGALEASVDAAVDIAAINVGGVPVQLTDDAGNPKYHDERINPGLSDLRFSVLRTWDKEIAQGVYPNNPLLFSPTGSDFDIMPKRRVMNRAHRAVRAYLARRLALPIRVDKKTGYIKNADAKDIESGGNRALAAALGSRVSGAYLVVNRTDNLLQKAPITGSYRLIPLAYPEVADFSAGFENPALNIIPV